MGIVDRVRETLQAAGSRAGQLLPGQRNGRTDARDRRARPADEGHQPQGATPFLHEEGEAAEREGDGASAPAQAAGRRTHTLQPGETLEDLAQRYAVSVEEIVALNGIEDAELVFAGQVFRLP